MKPENNSFTHPIIKSVRYTKMLPDGCSLVLEGGGTRGFYSAGVLEAFTDAGIMFPYIIGVSAGAANVLSYISGQPKRNRIIVEKYISNPKYLSYRNLIRHRSLFGYDFIFKTVPDKHIFWDRAAFDSADLRLLTGTTDCVTGETVWFEKSDIASGLDIVRASCSMPIASRIVKHGGYELLDGGVSSPISINKAIEDGNSFHVVILTQNKGYSKTPFKHKSILKLMYARYPRLVDAMLNRHEIYNNQLALCEQLEKDRKAIIIRPLEPLTVDRTGNDVKKLLSLYDEGHREGEIAVRAILERFS